MRFENLDVWKRSARLSSDLFKRLVDLRNFAFKDQVCRSALSIPSNIAEGYERNSDRDRIKFLSYAKGSCGELRTQVFIGMEAGFIDPDDGRSWLRETRELSAMLYSLMKQLRNQSEPNLRDEPTEYVP